MDRRIHVSYMSPRSPELSDQFGIDDNNYGKYYVIPRSRFGLYHVDFEDPSRPRKLKKSGEYYRDVVSKRRLPDDINEDVFASDKRYAPTTNIKPLKWGLVFFATSQDWMTIVTHVDETFHSDIQWNVTKKIVNHHAIHRSTFMNVTIYIQCNKINLCKFWLTFMSSRKLFQTMGGNKHSNINSFWLTSFPQPVLPARRVDFVIWRTSHPCISSANFKGILQSLV